MDGIDAENTNLLVF